MGKAPEGLAILAAANHNFLYGPFPTELLQGFEPSERHRVFVEACRSKEVRDGLVQIPIPENRNIKGTFGLQAHLNSLRALRPVGESRKVDQPIDKPFSTSDFNFQKTHPLETFYNGSLGGELSGTQFSLLYNLIPFAVGHSIFVPEIGAGHNQYIGEMKRLTMAWEFLSKIADPTVWAGYNSLGAYASMPQYHWQIVNETTNWQPAIATHLDKAPICTSTLTSWPLEQTTAFRGSRSLVLSGAFELIDRINTLAKSSPNQFAYNIWMRVRQDGQDGDIVVLPRRHQSTQTEILNGPEGKHTTGMAFFETGGNVIIPSEDTYKATTEADLTTHFSNLSLPQNI